MRTPPLASCARPLVSAAEKRRLRALTGAIAADMEAAGVAAAATSWAVVRAVVDPAAWTLPSVVVDGTGTIRPAPGIALELVRHPGELVAVARLARAYRRACRNLEAIARALAAVEA